MFIPKLIIISPILIHLNMHCLNLLIILQPIFTFTRIHGILNITVNTHFLIFKTSRNATYQFSRPNKSIAPENFVFNAIIKTHLSHIIKLGIFIFNWESNSLLVHTYKVLQILFNRSLKLFTKSIKYFIENAPQQSS